MYWNLIQTAFVLPQKAAVSIQGVVALYHRRTCTSQYYYPSGKYVLFARFTLTCCLYHVFGIMEPPTYQVSLKALHLSNTTLQSSTRPRPDLTITLTRLSILTINSIQSMMKRNYSQQH